MHRAATERGGPEGRAASLLLALSDEMLELIIAHGALELHFAEHVRGRAARHMRTYSLRHALGKGQTSLETADGALRVALTPHADGSTWLIRSMRIHDIAPLFGSPLRRVSVAADAEARDASPAAAAAVRRQSTLATGAAGSPSPLSKRGSVGGGGSIWGSAREVSSREVASREHDGAEQSARERRARAPTRAVCGVRVGWRENGSTGDRTRRRRIPGERSARRSNRDTRKPTRD